MTDSFQLLQVLGVEQSGTGDGDGLPARTEHGPAVGATFGDPEGFSFFQQMEDWEVVDSALTAFGEAESGAFAFSQSSVLDSYQLARYIVVRDLEPGGAVAVGPGGEATPTDDGRV